MNEHWGSGPERNCVGVDDGVVEGGETRAGFNANISRCLGLVRALSASYADLAKSRTKKY